MNGRMVFGAFILVAGVIVFMVVPAVLEPRTPSSRLLHKARMRQLRLAIDAYREANGAYPPAYINGSDGVPWHSWRVLILPYIEEKALYNAYNFQQPWSSDANSQIVRGGMPSIFGGAWVGRRTEADGLGKTSILAVVSRDSLWPGSRSFVPPRGVFVGDKIFLVETKDQFVNWMEPKDFEVNDALLKELYDPESAKKQIEQWWSVETFGYDFFYFGRADSRFNNLAERLAITQDELHPD